MAYDASGTLHVAYYDSASTSLKYAERNTAGVWSTTVTLDPGPRVGSSLAIAIDSVGHTGIAYYDAKKADLKYAYFNGNSWSISRVDAAGNVGQNPSLTFDLSNHPLISYFNKSAGDLKLAQFNGSRWVTSVIDRKGTAGQFSSIAIDPADGSWAIAYDQTSKRQVKLATQAGQHITLATFVKTKAWSSDPSLAFSTTGMPAVSFFDPSTKALKLASDAGSWTVQTVATGTIGAQSLLSFDPISGLPQIAYIDTSTGSLNLATSSNGSWSAVSLGSGSNLSLARDPLTNSFGTLAGAPTSLNAPNNLQATANADGSVHLTWQDASTNVTGFRVEVSTDGLSFAIAGQTSALVMQFDDVGAQVDQTFYYRVVPFNALGDGPATAPLLVHTAPAAPSGLKVFAEGTTEFELIWPQITDSATHLLVQERVAGTGNAFTTIDTITADQLSDMVTLAPDGSALATNAAYEFRLIAENVDGASSAPSNIATGSTGIIDPEDVAATALSATSVSLSWEPNSGAATHYNVYLSTDGSNYSIYSPTYQQASMLLLPDLLPSNHYWLKVTATDGTTESAGVVTQVDTMAGSPGAAPINVAAQISDDNPLYLSLSWTNVASDAIGFHVQRSTDNIHFTTIEDVSATWMSYDDPSVLEGTYYYRVQTITASGDGAISTSASATEFLANPINLAATVTTTGTVNLTWTNVSALATGLQLYAIDSSLNSILVDGSVSPTATQYAVTQFADGTPLTAGATYWFYLEPTGDIPTFGSSQWVQVTNGFAAPAQISATSTGDGQITINWSDVGDETGYELQSSTDGVHYSDLAPLGPDVTTYTQDGLAEGATMYYRVMALGSSGNSPYSSSTSAVVAPNAPTNLVVTPLAGGSFSLTWDDNSSDEDGYSVSFRSNNGDVMIPAQLPPDATSCTVTAADLDGLSMP
ncbi:MAG TPA: fibronectin type III domain-containing protein, partial [Tepidisphaeraceae bacterium]|nr:fibronectin type III domain-containing protein [Tepidisphaeraceae bacterium]